MGLSNYVDITIKQDSVGLARRGFGVPAIISHSASWVEFTRVYKKASEVLADFASSSPEYLTAVALFKQTPKPKTIIIARAASNVTAIYRLTPITAVANQAYIVGCSGEGVTSETVTHTSVASPTIATICTGLAGVINAVTGKNFTAVATATYVDITSNAANDWFALATDPNLLKTEQTHADPGMVVDLTAIQLANSGWYVPLTHFNSNAYVLAVSGWVETQKKIYLFDVAESDAVNTPAGNSDTLDDISASNSGRSSGSWHPRPADFITASWAGRCLPEDPGGITWNSKQVVGPTPSELSSTQRANLKARSANFYEEVLDGVSIMTEGTTADGDFIDIQRGMDWWDDDLGKSLFELQLAAGKIGMDDPGIITVGSAMLASGDRAVTQKILKADPAPAVSLPLAEDITPADRAARILRDLQISGEFRGAIHKMYVTASIS